MIFDFQRETVGCLRLVIASTGWGTLETKRSDVIALIQRWAHLHRQRSPQSLPVVTNPRSAVTSNGLQSKVGVKHLLLDYRVQDSLVPFGSSMVNPRTSVLAPR